MSRTLTVILALFAISLSGQNKFAQIDELLPTPNTYRTASGAPGHEYWQQRADYSIDIELDDKNQKIYGKETITYHNESPDVLTYLWLQLDQNRRAKDSDTYLISKSQMNEKVNSRTLEGLTPEFDGGFKIVAVTDPSGEVTLPYTINKTMMRVDLDTPLEPGESYSFNIKWWYNINNRMEIGGRSGYEYFEDEDNYLYTIAQFYPRMCMYNDVYGWQNKQFLGRGEFTLSFGDFDVRITVPEDHLVAATGELINEAQVLTAKQRERLAKARNSFTDPVIIVSEAEAKQNEKTKSSQIKTWHFKAENVRDFAFASSRKFIWDAMAVLQEDGSKVMAMSMYPEEGNPLWEKYSTKTVAHTLRTFSSYTFPYPYPVAWSINAARIGMEYPMICFNFGRPEEDDTYSERTKYGMIGVIIHEVGHNYFPMIVNSDERQWTWMDEGLTTFLQYLTEQEFERNYPSRRGPAHKIVDYMKGDKDFISPIMTNSESIHQFGNNAYGKPATALNILRETIMGRELFDMAFKEYANRWKFKHPTPADFFRTMEDASAVDLDWFWRSWFYTNDHVDLSINKVALYNLDTQNPRYEKEAARRRAAESPKNISSIRNEKDIAETYNERDPSLNDFYTSYDPYDVTDLDEKEYQKYIDGLSDPEKRLLKNQKHYYEISFENKGGIPMPIILDFQYQDGSHEVKRIPAEIWRFDDTIVSKVFATDKIIEKIVLDPYLETADTDRSDNYFPQQITPSRFEMYKEQNDRRQNKMQRAKGQKEINEP
jgi:hypothetical protein